MSNTRYSLFISTTNTSTTDSHFSLMKQSDFAKKSALKEEQMQFVKNAANKWLTTFIYKKNDPSQRLMIALRKKPKSKEDYQNLIKEIDSVPINEMESERFQLFQFNSIDIMINVKKLFLFDIKDEIKKIPPPTTLPDCKEEEEEPEFPELASATETLTGTSEDSIKISGRQSFITPSPSDLTLGSLTESTTVSSSHKTKEEQEEEEEEEAQRFIRNYGY